MNLGELRALTRRRLADVNEPYLWSDAFLDDALNNAVLEASERAWIISDRTTSSVVQLSYDADENGLDLHSSIIDIQYAFYTPTNIRLVRTSSADLQRRAGSNWHQDRGPVPEGFYLQNNKLYLYPTPSQAGSLNLWVYRRPLDTEIMADDADVPPIHSTYHRKLVDWACFEAYSEPDPDTFNQKRADMYEAKFLLSFGPRPSARLEAYRQGIGVRNAFPRPLGG